VLRSLFERFGRVYSSKASSLSVSSAKGVVEKFGGVLKGLKACLKPFKYFELKFCLIALSVERLM
jgi:ribosomal protein L7Ae-like RNA K-turn-binding protein